MTGTDERIAAERSLWSAVYVAVLQGLLQGRVHSWDQVRKQAKTEADIAVQGLP